MREREAFKKFDKVFREEKVWLEMKVNNIEEMVKKMGEIDEMLEVVTKKEKEKEKGGKGTEKEEGEGRTVAAVNNGTKKYTGAMVIITIAKKQVKVMIDSGACETIIALSWVEHLGLKKMIDTRAEVPKDLASVRLGKKG